MKNQIAQFQQLALNMNEKLAIKGGVESVETNLPEAQIPTGNGIYYPCGLPVVSHP